MVGYGIVGTGMIAGTTANALAEARNASLVAAASRTAERAASFARTHGAERGYGDYRELAADPDIGAVYVATPTTAKEAIALALIAAGKSVIVDKPFTGAASVERMIAAATEAGVAFMDATHFVHNARHEKLKRKLSERVGEPKSLYTNFYFPNTDEGNIRYDPTLEPTGAFGDMGWYSMRALVEYLDPAGDIDTLSLKLTRHPGTGAVTRAVGMVGFESGEAALFDVGYTCATLLMDFHLLGTDGVVSMDDFVLNWTNSSVSAEDRLPTRFRHRQGLEPAPEQPTVEVDVPVAQQVRMVERFAEFASGAEADAAQALAAATLETQRLLDALWTAARG